MSFSASLTTVSSDVSLVSDSSICARWPTSYPVAVVISSALLRWECRRFRSDLHDSILILCSSNICVTFIVKDLHHSSSVLITGHLVSAFVAFVSYRSKIKCLCVNCWEIWHEFGEERTSATSCKKNPVAINWVKMRELQLINWTWLTREEEATQVLYR